MFFILAMCNVQVYSLLLWFMYKLVENAKLITIKQSIILGR